MFARCRSLVWSPILTIIASLCHAAPSPGVFEVDLLFPRDGETYTPEALMPVAFAVQNPALADLLVASLSWSFFEQGGSKVSGPYNTGGQYQLSQHTSSTNDSYLQTAIIDSLYGVEGVWQLQWHMIVYNCTDGYPFSDLNDDNFNTITFTTKNGSSAPDLVAATAASSCGSAANMTFDVVGFDTNWDEQQQDPGNQYCPILSNNPTATANPCAVTIGPSAASSISASATASRCSQASAVGTSYPGLQCANSSNQSTSSSSAMDSFPHLSLGAMALTMLMGLICFL